MTARDPFSDEADPYRDEQPIAPVSHPDPADGPPIARRTFAGLLVSLPVLAAGAGGCAHVHPACVAPAEPSRSCRHRFCRNYRP